MDELEIATRDEFGQQLGLTLLQVSALRLSPPDTTDPNPMTMKRNLLNLLTLTGLIVASGVANAQDTNAVATNATAGAVVAETNAPASPEASTNMPAPTADEVNPALKALVAAAPKNGPVTDINSLVTRLSQRNIFNPSRVPNVPDRIRTFTQPTRTDWFSLQGTSRNDNEWAAFFDAHCPDYRKTVQCGDTIAGYKVAEINTDYVMLAAASNKTVKLPIQSQMRRSGTGPWSLGGRPGAFGSVGSDSGDAALSESLKGEIAGGGAAADALKRLMAKRLQEQ